MRRRIPERSKAMVRFPQQDFRLLYRSTLTAAFILGNLALADRIDISNAFYTSQGDGVGFGQDQMGMNGMGQGRAWADAEHGMGQMPNMGMGQMPNMAWARCKAWVRVRCRTWAWVRCRVWADANGHGQMQGMGQL